MAVRSKEELLKLINEKLGDDPSEEDLGILEDITDTYDDLSSKSSTDWKQRYDDLNKSWTEKYRARFLTGEDSKLKGELDTDPDDAPEEKPLRYEDLFKKEN